MLITSEPPFGHANTVLPPPSALASSAVAVSILALIGGSNNVAVSTFFAAPSPSPGALLLAGDADIAAAAAAAAPISTSQCDTWKRLLYDTASATVPSLAMSTTTTRSAGTLRGIASPSYTTISGRTCDSGAAPEGVLSCTTAQTDTALLASVIMTV